MNYGSKYGDDPDPAVNEFFKRFEAKYGKPADVSYGLRGYSAVQAWATAANKAGSLDGAKVAAVLDTFAKEPLVIGPTTYTPELHIQTTRPMSIIGVTDGKFAAVGRFTVESFPPLRMSRTGTDAASTRCSLRRARVTVRFGGLVAVDDVTLTLARGEIVGLIGPNGAGKTTLINVLSGFQRPRAGTIHVGDSDCTRLPRHGFPRAGIVAHLPGRAAVQGADRQRERRGGLCGARARPRRGAAAGARNRSTSSGSPARPIDPAASLSYGEERRVGLARALAAQSALPAARRAGGGPRRRRRPRSFAH